MTEKERQDLIEFIKRHDRAYNYSKVNFMYYSDRDLLRIKERICAGWEQQMDNFQDLQAI